MVYAAPLNALLSILISLCVLLGLFGCVLYYLLHNPKKYALGPWLYMAAGLVGVLVSLAMTGMVPVPPTIPVAVLPAVITVSVAVFGVFQFLSGRWKPVEMRSIVFEATSSIDMIINPSRMADYTVPYATAESYMREVPIELFNRSDRDLTIWSIWMEAFPKYPYPNTINPFRRKKLLFKPLPLPDCGIKNSFPLKFEKKKPVILNVDVYAILSLTDVLASSVREGTPVPSARLVIQHSLGETRTHVFCLGTFHNFYQLMAKNLSKRQLRGIVAEGIANQTPPEKLYSEVVTAFKKLGFDPLIATNLFLWEIQTNHPKSQPYLDYAGKILDGYLGPLKKRVREELESSSLEKSSK